MVNPPPISQRPLPLFDVANTTPPTTLVCSAFSSYFPLLLLPTPPCGGGGGGDGVGLVYRCTVLADYHFVSRPFFPPAKRTHARARERAKAVAEVSALTCMHTLALTCTCEYTDTRLASFMYS